MTLSDVPEVKPGDVPAGALVIDVREIDEWVAGHVVGARHVPLSELPDRLSELPQQEQLFIVCRSGGRSARAVAFLSGCGFDAVNIAGGTWAWHEADLPMESENGQQPSVM
ncbi:rhodanese-like domain-containing protein [Dermatophilus congolensis]|uniref:rhodanese-like domain-containing protein n=1 Tax=Dermatophilus congolensis TaxID=1863 RepID=UPI001AAF93C8|nr:rhodanese-like domain-containing protein [Dermatophilus congolensis]